MADKENSSEIGMTQNIETSELKESNDGKTPCTTDLAQTIVADREFIAQIWSAIWTSIAKNFASNPDASAVNTAMPVGHAEPVNPVVSVDLTGMNANTDQISQASVNPTESVDQLGGEKRPCADHHIALNVASKRTRTSSLIAPELDFQEDTNSDFFDDELFSPNSRWEAREELSTFLNTASKRLNRFERRSLLKTFPHPDVNCIYTPSLDQYLKPFVQGVAAPDKPLKELQDKVLDILGPLSTIYENLLSMFLTMEKRRCN